MAILRNVQESKKTLTFPRLSFLKGMTRAVDFGQRISRYRRVLGNAQIDRDALASDWQIIGADLRQAMAQFTRENQRQRPR
jgi:hypothetical protein